MVYLFIKNITMKRLSYKLDFKYIGPYKIVKKVLKNNYELDLLPKVRLYLIFYILLLELAEGMIWVRIDNELTEVEGLEVYKAEEIRDM